MKVEENNRVAMRKMGQQAQWMFIQQSKKKLAQEEAAAAPEPAAASGESEEKGWSSPKKMVSFLKHYKVALPCPLAAPSFSHYFHCVHPSYHSLFLWIVSNL